MQWLSPEIWARTQHWGIAAVVGQSDFQREKQSHIALPPHRLPELTSRCAWCWVVKHLICKPENCYYRITIFPEQRVYFVNGPGVRAQWGHRRCLSSPLPGWQNKVGGCVPQAHPTPTHCRYTNGSQRWIGANTGIN